MIRKDRQKFLFICSLDIPNIGGQGTLLYIISTLGDTQCIIPLDNGSTLSGRALNASGWPALHRFPFRFSFGLGFGCEFRQVESRLEIPRVESRVVCAVDCFGGHFSFAFCRHRQCKMLLRFLLWKLRKIKIHCHYACIFSYFSQPAEQTKTQENTQKTLPHAGD